MFSLDIVGATSLLCWYSRKATRRFPEHERLAARPVIWDAGHAMPKDSELIRMAYEAWNSGDRDAWLQTLHPQAEWHTSSVYPDLDPVYRGHERLAEFWRHQHEAWEAHRIEVERFDEQGDCFVVEVRFRAKGIDSGLDVDMKATHAIRVRNGLIVAGVTRSTAEEAREALPEDQPSARSQRP
jgi:ketosteroid isomerase-like protein